MGFDLKHLLRRKCQLVANGKGFDSMNINVSSSNVISVLVRLSLIAGARLQYDVLYTDITNAYLNTYTSETVLTRLGDDFGDLDNTTVRIIKALYRLRASDAALGRKLVGTLREMRFIPSCLDGNLWICYHKSSNTVDYIAASVNDALISSCRPLEIFQKLASIYQLKKYDMISRYLRIDLVQKEQNMILLAHLFIRESIRKIELDHEPIKSAEILAKPNAHIELDTSLFLSKQERNVYQRLVGIASWAQIMCRLDISFVVNRYALFQAAPRKGHLEAILQVWDYLGKFLTKGIIINLKEPVFIALAKKHMTKVISKIYILRPLKKF